MVITHPFSRWGLMIHIHLGLVILLVVILLSEYAAHTQSLDPYTSPNMKIKGVRPILTDMQGMFIQYPDLTEAALLTLWSQTALSDLKYSPDTDWPGAGKVRRDSSHLPCPEVSISYLPLNGLDQYQDYFMFVFFAKILSFVLFCFSLRYINVYPFNTVKILLPI